jgi:hypothetical protein
VQERLADLVDAAELAPAPPTPAQLRAWAGKQGLQVSAKGRVPESVVQAYADAHAAR